MSKYLVVEFTDTLMRWDNYLEAYVQSGDRLSNFYFRVPDWWLAGSDEELQERVKETARQMYSDMAAHFRAVEPDDINYIAVLGTKATALSDEEARAEPWLSAPAPAAWEWTPCVVAREDGTYEKVDPRDFGESESV
jgi:hypothetical protein